MSSLLPVTGFLGWIPLFQETTDTIRARINADANAGLAPTDPAFLDLTEGGFFYDLTQAPILEMERQWDAISTELPMAIFPAFTWGIYMDEHGITVAVPRKPPAAASGVVTFLGDPATIIAPGVQVSTVQTDPSAEPLTFSVTVGGTIPAGGSIDLDVVATQQGSAWNVPAGAITVLSGAVSGAVSNISNPAPMSGGADVESDEQYRARLLQVYGGAHGGGTVADYEQWALAYPGVGYVTVLPLWNGPGTIKVVITDEFNNPASTDLVAGLQSQLDPNPQGQGYGLAPVGSTVTVQTPTLIPVSVSATLTLQAGYTLTGATGTVGVGASVTQAITNYVNTLPPGGDVIVQSVVAAIMSVTGVMDTTDPLLNGTAANFVVGGAQVAEAGAVALS